MTSSLRFRREHHVRRGADFDRAYTSGARRDLGWCVVHGAANGLPFSRLGLSVSRRCGNAVRRHRIKRMLREGFRLTADALPTGLDLVVVARFTPRADAARPSLQEACDAFHAAAPALARRLLSEDRAPDHRPTRPKGDSDTRAES